MRRYAPLFAVVLLALALATLAGVHKLRTPATHMAKTVKPESKPAAKPVAITQKAGEGFNIRYEPATVKAVLQPYTAKADLSNVANAALFGKFTPEQKSLLSKNAFFVSPTDEQQLFYVYEQNDYLNIPSFVTSDSVLQVYHIFFDFTLRRVESDKLYGVLQTLSDGMQKESDKAASQVTDAEWKKAAAADQVYFAVPNTILGAKPKLGSPDQERILKAEIDLINKAEGRTNSALFPYKPDYSQFIPRGHYTRSDKLKAYFKAMMWYGYMPFATQWPEGAPDWPRIRQALLISLMLHRATIDGKPAIDTWERIYEPTAFYVGSADDLTPRQYMAIIEKVYGAKATYKDLQDEAKLKEAYAEIMKLPAPQIDVALVGMPTGRQWKLMGQRYMADSEMFQKLVSYPERKFPMGLDVMAVLGSKRAADILDNTYREPKAWPGYVPARDKLKTKFGATPQETWQSNLYWGWLWSLDSLLDPLGQGYPSFMTSQAWEDKSLNAGLASWAELRHDTILYAKQSGAECGDGEEVPPPLPKGYVEPNVEFYSRLLWLTKASMTGLDQRQLLSDDLRDSFHNFVDMLTFLRSISVKELTNQKVTKAEYDQIRLYGANLESLTTSVVEGGGGWYQITSDADKNMAVVADVHTCESDCLEEGVGHAQEIYVVVAIEGKLYLTRGAVFSYYEFTHPIADRLTDEKWQAMLKNKKAPEIPIWMKSFRTGKKSEVPVPKKTRSTGC